LQAALTQPSNQPVSVEEEIVLFYAFKRKILEAVTPAESKRFIEGFFAYLEVNLMPLVNLIKEKRTLTEEIKSRLDNAMMSFFNAIKEEGK
jgi:F-type H+-transporting ATPase subunit alpha